MAKRLLDPDDYILGLVCALPVELAAMEAMLDEEHCELPIGSYDPSLYTLGRIFEHNVVISCLPSGQTGMTSIAIITSRLISSFRKIKFILLVGIGGGVPNTESDVRLGDVVVSQPQGFHGGLVQYDLGKSKLSGFERTGSLNSPPTALLNAVSKLKANRLRGRGTLSQYLSRTRTLPEFSRKYAEPDLLFIPEYEHIGGKHCENCSKDQLVQRELRDSQDPVVHYGTIASGNRVIRSAIVRDRISAGLGGVLCLEMEAAGVMDNTPCLVIRGICDYADSHANKLWQPYAAATAAAYAKELLSIILLVHYPIVREATSSDVASGVGGVRGFQSSGVFQGTTSTISIFIKSLTGESFEMHTEPLSTIGDIKGELNDKHCIPSDRYVLMFAGDSLEEDRGTLLYHRIRDGSTIHLLLRERGSNF